MARGRFGEPDYGKEYFKKEFAQHELKVRHGDGLYRHLVCARPNTYLNSFAIITWPGYLTISGDCEGFVFARVPDMFEFFRPNSGWNSCNINPDYWAEKIQDGRERAKEYDPSLAAACVWAEVREAYREYGKEACGLARAVKAQVVSDWPFDFENSSRDTVYGFEFPINNSTFFRFGDTSDWKVRGWTHAFLWCCHAVQWAIAAYDKQKAVATAPEYPAVGSTIPD